ncbi:MAG: lactonase family protein [Verrucomicrobiales bacterium]
MKIMIIFSLVTLVLFASSLFCFAADAGGKETFAYIGTYTGGKSKGVYIFKVDPSSGKLTDLGLAAETVSPSFLVVHPNKQFLFAANEVGEYQGKPAGYVTSFKIDSKTGKLTEINQQSSMGAAPCHVSIDKTGKFLFVANYTGGSVAAYPIKEDGSLGSPSAFVQHPTEGNKKPHGHFINVDASNRHALVCDLGLDRVMIYDFDQSKGTLKVHDPAFAQLKEGAGPRHFAFTPDAKRVYVNGELNMTLNAFAYDQAKGSLTAIDSVSTLPPNTPTKGFSTAQVMVHPNGKYAYVSNRGHDTIAVFELDAATGKMKLAQNAPSGGKIPRNFNIDPSGKFLYVANQESENIVSYTIDENSGKLTATGETHPVGKPVCIVFLTR